MLLVAGASNNTIGGASAAARNVISGNGSDGVDVDGFSASTAGNVIQGNFIGTNAAGNASIRNSGSGIVLEFTGASNNFIGGAGAGDGNLISGNGLRGISVSRGTGNQIVGNRIGTDASGTADVGNGFDGVFLVNGASTNSLNSNVISFNRAAGIATDTSVTTLGNQFLGNSIFSNRTLGIDLAGNGVTANDNLDADTGPNGFQNSPVITAVVGPQIFGSLHSTPNTTFRLEFFSSAARDPSGFGEGQTFIGTVDVTTDAGGNAPFTINAPSSLVGQFISATATTTTTTGGTSEFSNTVLGIPTPTATPNLPPTPIQVPNPLPTATPPANPILIPQLIINPNPGATPILVPLLLPAAIPQLVPQLTPNLAPVPVLNTPIVPPGVTPVVTAGQIAPTAGAAQALQAKGALVVGAGLGGHSIAAVYNSDGSLRAQLTAFPGFSGGVRIGTADVNNDGHLDLLAGAGIGAPGGHVKVFSGIDGSEIRSFFAFEGFTGGVFVAGGDLNADGFAEIIVGAGPGAPGGHVKVFDGATGTELASFFAFGPGFLGGVSVGASDLNNDGLADVVVGAGPGAGPHVKVIEGTSLNQINPDGQIADSALLASFFAFGPGFLGGVFVSSDGDFDNDGLPDVLIGAGPGASPHVKLVSGASMTQTNPDGQISDAALIASFLAFDEGFRGGVRVGEADSNGNGMDEILLAAGPGADPDVRALSGVGFTDVFRFDAFDVNFNGGVFVD